MLNVVMSVQPVQAYLLQPTPYHSITFESHNIAFESHSKTLKSHTVAYNLKVYHSSCQLLYTIAKHIT